MAKAFGGDSLMAISLVKLPRAGDPDVDLILTLEKLLEEEKTGELQGIAYAAMYSVNEFKVDWEGRSTALPLLGAITMLSYTFSNALDSIPPEED